MHRLRPPATRPLPRATGPGGLRWLAGLVAVALVVSVPPGTAGWAQTPPGTTPGATVPDPDPTWAGPATSAPPGDGSQPGTTEDPLKDEAPGETVPPDRPTVPAPTGFYAGQKPYQPARILRSSVRAAQQQLTEATATHQDLIRQAHDRARQLKALGQRQAGLEAADRQATTDLDAARETLKQRAVAAFVANDQATEAIVGTLARADPDNVLDLQIRQKLLGTALGSDRDAITAYVELKQRLGADLVATVDALNGGRAALTDAEAQADDAGRARAQAQAALAAFQAGSQVFISGVVFPVAEPYTHPIVDSFGAPRLVGTPQAHWHEGIDIFAATGTPILATERGVVTRVGSNTLGGLTVWLHGESNADWYFAHMVAQAPDLKPGMVVEAGHVLGWVGGTGDASGGPTHLHIELHPDGGDAVNPYPLLKVVSDAEARPRP